MSTYQLTVPISYMTPPILTFDEITVLTAGGEAKMAGKHTWHPVHISFTDLPKVLEETLVNPIFDLRFITEGNTWELTGCFFTSLNMINRHELTMQYQNARLFTESNSPESKS